MSLSVSVGKYSIHSAEAVAFVRKLEPEEIVLSIMEEGLKFDFLEVPPPYFEKNNRSCLENLEVAQTTTEKWLKKGFIYEVKQCSYVCFPSLMSSSQVSIWLVIKMWKWEVFSLSLSLYYC